MSYDLVIRGGTLVHPWGRVEADIGVRGETIAAIATPGETLAGKREIDARGRALLDQLAHQLRPVLDRRERQLDDAAWELAGGRNSQHALGIRDFLSD